MQQPPWLALLALICALSPACGEPAEAPLGSKERPLRMHFVPSEDAAKVVDSAGTIARAITARTGLHIASKVPPSYAAVLTELDTGRADVVWLGTFATVSAHERSGAEVGLTIVRHGEEEYYGQILVRADSGIEELRDLAGKRIAYTDPLSSAGYLYPAALLERAGVEPGRTLFAGGHPQAVMAVYQGSVDAACSFWSPPGPDGAIGDARKLVLDKWPDVEERLRVLAKTDPIPNNTVCFRRDLAPEIRERIVEALLDYASTEEGKHALEGLYSITGFVRSSWSRYEPVKGVLEAVGMSLDELVK